MEKAVNMIVVVNRNYLLLTKIREGDFWILPGGRIEEGESEEVAIRKEIGEELPNIRILKLIPYKKFKGTTPHTKVKVIVSTFFAGITGSIEPGAEITETTFSLINSLKELNLTLISKDIIKSLKKDGYLIK